MGLGIGECDEARRQARCAGGGSICYNAVQKYLREQTRLGIPALLHEESLHGLVAPDATSFPQAIALGATFDPDLRRASRSDRGCTPGTRPWWVEHVLLAPVLDVARDPRWGRIEETYGEDPYLTTQIGVAATFGLQGRRAADAPIDSQHRDGDREAPDGTRPAGGRAQHRPGKRVPACPARSLSSAVRSGGAAGGGSRA